MLDSFDELDDASPDELREIIEEQRQRLALFAQVLLSLGFEPADLMGAVE